MGAAAPPIAVNLSEVLVSRRHRASCAPAHNNFVPLRLEPVDIQASEVRKHRRNSCDLTARGGAEIVNTASYRPKCGSEAAPQAAGNSPLECDRGKECTLGLLIGALRHQRRRPA
jgi:hypothetical protein